MQWIWFITNAPCDFIIFALSDKEGMSLSFNVRGWHENAIPSWLTAVVPTMYKFILVALCFKYSLSSLLIDPSGLEQNNLMRLLLNDLGLLLCCLKYIFRIVFLCSYQYFYVLYILFIFINKIMIENY